uniref:Uncharacterized protein n=1 Tax=Globodera rostochiensis TaxID=31243 RepID=A0A914IBG4_GLORO
MAIVRSIVHSFDEVAFVLGILLNGILTRLILRHTPKIMQIYSKILLQTCLVDVLVLVMNLLFHSYFFVTENGAQEVILDGLFTLQDTAEHRIWVLLVVFMFTLFLLCMSMLGYVSQFIYRYLALNWNKKLSSWKYFSLLGVVVLPSSLFFVNAFQCLYLSDGSKFLDDQSFADILGLNLTENIALIGYSTNNTKMAIGCYYFVALLTIAYVIIFTLAFRMHKFMREQSKTTTSSKLVAQMIEMNKQIGRNLLIQEKNLFF